MLDTSDEALALGIKSTPTMIKPNLEEARQFLGEVGVEDMAQRELSDHILAMGVRWHTMVTDDTFGLLDSLTIVEMNPAVAGDSLAADMVYWFSGGDSFADALKFGIACGAATGSCLGTELGDRRRYKSCASL